MLFNTPISMGFGNGIGTPAGFLVATIVLTIFSVGYVAGEAESDMFGGNSNWRGPVWFPVNYLIIESLQKFHFYLGDGYKVEFPTGSQTMLSLWDVAAEISRHGGVAVCSPIAQASRVTRSRASIATPTC